MAKVKDVLKMMEGMPGVTDGKHTIVIHGGCSKNWWDNYEAPVHNVTITATRINLYV